MPCLWIIGHNLSKPAYKIMFSIGLLDVFMLTGVTGVYGVFAIRGDVFCSHPTLTYTIGCFDLGTTSGRHLVNAISNFSHLGLVDRANRPSCLVPLHPDVETGPCCIAVYWPPHVRLDFHIPVPHDIRPLLHYTNIMELNLRHDALQSTCRLLRRRRPKG